MLQIDIKKSKNSKKIKIKTSQNKTKTLKKATQMSESYHKLEKGEIWSKRQI